MALIDRGRSAAEHTRHIAIRYFWVKERVDTGEARVRHLGTKKMYANLLTKRLQGTQFQEERRGITGWNDAIGPIPTRWSLELSVLELIKKARKLQKIFYRPFYQLQSQFLSLKPEE